MGTGEDAVWGGAAILISKTAVQIKIKKASRADNDQGSVTRDQEVEVSGKTNKQTDKQQQQVGLVGEEPNGNEGG